MIGVGFLAGCVAALVGFWAGYRIAQARAMLRTAQAFSRLYDLDRPLTPGDVIDAFQDPTEKP